MRPFLLLAALLSLVVNSRAQTAPQLPLPDGTLLAPGAPPVAAPGVFAPPVFVPPVVTPPVAVLLPPRSTSSANFSSEGLFPFALPPLDDAPNVFDLSGLNPKPAGAAGFVRVEGEHFVDGAGQILRLWGVNLNFEGVFPDKALAPKIAGRLAKFGFNSVRLHQFEGNAAPKGLWKAAAIGSSRIKTPRELDEGQLDRLDFFVAELIKRGIYINFNLHVARKTTEADGVVNAALLPDKDKGMAALDARVAGQNRAFARFLLGHVNPYTGRAYRDEPGVCALEVENESSTLAQWLDGSLLRLPPPYSENLRVGWNDWLIRKYGSEAALHRAWTEIAVPLFGPDLLLPPTPVAAPTAPVTIPTAPVAAPMATPEPTPTNSPVDPTAPTILGEADNGPADLLPDGTVAPPSLQTPSPPAISPQIAAGLDLWRLNLAGGAQGGVARDDLGGPSLDGFVQPGLSVALARAGSVSWAFQLVRDGLSLDDGKPYTLSFWARSSVARTVSVNLWSDSAPFPWLGYTGAATLSSDWQPFSFTLRATGASANHVRLALNLSNATGNVQLGGFSLRRGGTIAAPDSWNLRGATPIPDAKAEPIGAVRRDFALFLGELEAKNASQMRDFLKTEMGARVPIWQTQAQFGGWGGVERERLSDAIDNHVYWKHPDFAGAGWGGGTYRIENQSMAATPLGDPLAAYAMLRVPGKPFVVTEFNSGQPNDYGAESLPMLAAFAAWQDWAGAWIFDYHSSGDFERNKFENFFSIDTQPVKMATAPLAALLFRRPNAIAPQGDTERLPAASQTGDVAPATASSALNLPTDAAWSEVAGTPGVPAAAVFLKTWNAAGAPRGVGLTGRAAVTNGRGLFASPTLATADVPTQFRSDTGQLFWNASEGLWSVNAPSSRVVAGFVGGRKIVLDEAQFWVAPSSKWATIGLSSLDLGSISDSKRLLLTLTGRAENVGMRYNSDRSSIGSEWGVGPTYVAGISAKIKLLTAATRAQVWALDERGARRGQLASSLQDGVLKFEVSPVWRTLWYEIALD